MLSQILQMSEASDFLIPKVLMQDPAAKPKANSSHVDTEVENVSIS